VSSAFNYRIIKVWWDISLNRLYNSSGNVLAESLYPYIFYQEKVLLRIQLCDGAKANPFTGVPTGASIGYLMAASVSLASGSDSLILLSDDSLINVPGTWNEDSGGPTDPDPEQGQFTVLLNAFNNPFKDAINGYDRRQLLLELQAWSNSPSNQLVYALRLPFFGKDTVYYAGDIPPLPSISHEGATAVPQGANTLTVTVESAVRIVTWYLEGPAGGAVLIGIVSSPDSAGSFTLTLSAPAPSGYVFHYITSNTPL